MWKPASTFVSILARPATIMTWSFDKNSTTFDGSDWSTLNRIIGECKLAFLQDDEYDDDHVKRCALLASRFSGAALDYVGIQMAMRGDKVALGNWDQFIEDVRDRFGILDENITALRRRQLEQLQFNNDAPIFFAELDGLFTDLGITGSPARIAYLQTKLPPRIKSQFAEQALSFASYEVMRSRVNMMWALDPGPSKPTLGPKKPRCGTCGKRGHVASDCRKSKN